MSYNGIKPFVGFTYNGVHSSQFGLIRTASGMSTMELAPTTNNVAIDNLTNGQYYYGSTFGAKTFTISYAFDQLRASQLDELKTWLGRKEIHPLIFDERPDVVWPCAVTGTSQMKYVAFGTGNDAVYKGEGDVTFTCYCGHGISKKTSQGEFDSSYQAWHFEFNNNGDSGELATIEMQLGNASLSYVEEIWLIFGNPTVLEIRQKEGKKLPLLKGENNILCYSYSDNNLYYYNSDITGSKKIVNNYFNISGNLSNSCAPGPFNFEICDSAGLGQFEQINLHYDEHYFG